MDTKEYFTKQSREYAKYRPHYPRELFQYIASVTPEHLLAWDCATGNGQAARGLSEFYDQVMATDVSSEQIQNSKAHPKIKFLVATAEKSGFPDHKFDLVTAATALHWFHLEKFYAEVKRVLKPGGVLAIWTYGAQEPTIDPVISEILARFSKDILGPYFAPEMKTVWNGYRQLPFPFEEISSPNFKIQVEWNLEQTLGYIFTWSAIQRFIEKNKTDPRELIFEELRSAWGPPERKIAREWSLDFRIGRNPQR